MNPQGTFSPAVQGTFTPASTPAATAILDRFLHHAEIIQITGRSYRLKDRATAQNAVDNEAN